MIKSNFNISFSNDLFSKILFAEVSIVAKVDNEIITNYDVKKESYYLKILNPNLKNLNDNQIFKLAKISLINEIIKKEIEKYPNLSEKEEFLNQYLENLYLRLNFNDEREFLEELEKNSNYDLDQIKKNRYWVIMEWIDFFKV